MLPAISLSLLIVIFNVITYYEEHKTCVKIKAKRFWHLSFFCLFGEILIWFWFDLCVCVCVVVRFWGMLVKKDECFNHFRLLIFQTNECTIYLEPFMFWIEVMKAVENEVFLHSSVLQNIKDLKIKMNSRWDHFWHLRYFFDSWNAFGHKCYWGSGCSLRSILFYYFWVLG